MKTIPCILIDTETNTEYPPMTRREAAELIGCGKSTVAWALKKEDTVIKKRFRVRNGEGSIPARERVIPEHFSEEWDSARKRILEKGQI